MNTEIFTLVTSTSKTPNSVFTTQSFVLKFSVRKNFSDTLKDERRNCSSKVNVGDDSW